VGLFGVAHLARKSIVGTRRLALFAAVAVLGVLTISSPNVAAASKPAVLSSAPSWPETAVTQTNLVGTPTALPGSPLAYGVTTASLVARYGPLTRLDVTTGQPTFGPTLPAASQFFAIGSSMAIISPAHEETSGATTRPWSLRIVKGTSTSLTAPKMLSFLPSPYPQDVTDGPAINRDDFWIGSGSSLFLVDASTGKVVRRESLHVQITSISVDPTGSLLYVALNELNKKGLVRALAPGPTVVDEFNAKTGRVLEHVGEFDGNGLATLDAVPGGVWFSARGGMAGSAELLRAAGLAMVKPPPGPPSFNEIIPTMGASITMGVETTYIGSTVWLTAASGLSCVAPSSGSFRGGTAFGTTGGWVPFTEWQGRLYLYAQQTYVNLPPGMSPALGMSPTPGILAVTPPSNC